MPENGIDGLYPDVKVTTKSPEQLRQRQVTRREALEIMGVAGLTLVLTGCKGSEITAPPAKTAQTTPEKPKQQLEDWEKPYPDDAAGGNEAQLGIIDRDLLNDREKELLNLDPMSMTNEQSAAYLSTMMGIYRHWSNFESKHVSTANPPLPYVYLDKLDESTTPDSINANLDLIGDGLYELCYTPDNTPDVTQIQRVLIASSFCQDNRGELARSQLANEAQVFTDITHRIHVVLSKTTISDYRYDPTTARATFKLRAERASVSGLKGQVSDSELEAYTQTFIDPKTDKPASIVLYNMLSKINYSL
ncbi:hypothetical protein FWF48_03465 [Candidatus Saccharibacteria bacterium]|nr:hypothetical protein [Candidatus Saccharibacteria bacterium]